MVKKGLSLEEKRERVLEFFHETDSVFQFKEVEKEAVKRGVTVQSVKDVVQSLVDDNLVNQALFLIKASCGACLARWAHWFTCPPSIVTHIMCCRRR
jgi:Fe2+ or Zn2+ uptake regulation protein